MIVKKFLSRILMKCSLSRWRSGSRTTAISRRGRPRRRRWRSRAAARGGWRCRCWWRTASRAPPRTAWIPTSQVVGGSGVGWRRVTRACSRGYQRGQQALVPPGGSEPPRQVGVHPAREHQPGRGGWWSRHLPDPPAPHAHGVRREPPHQRPAQHPPAGGDVPLHPEDGLVEGRGLTVVNMFIWSYLSYYQLSSLLLKCRLWTSDYHQ